jgi:hypothetical protein
MKQAEKPLIPPYQATTIIVILGFGLALGWYGVVQGWWNLW